MTRAECVLSVRLRGQAGRWDTGCAGIGRWDTKMAASRRALTGSENERKVGPWLGIGRPCDRIGWPALFKSPLLFSFYGFPAEGLFFLYPPVLLFSLAGSRQLEKDIAFITHSESYWLRESEGGAARVRGGRESHKNGERSKPARASD